MVYLRNRKKNIFYLYLFTLYIFFLSIDKSFSPDYIAYFYRGHHSEWYLNNQYYYGYLFNLLLNLLWKSNLSYHGIVNLIYSLSFSLFLLSILNYSKHFDLFRNKKFYIIFIIFITYSVLIVFEFFVIRLRSGLSLSLMFLSFSFLLNKQNYLFIVSILASFLVHIETTICFIYVSIFLYFFIKTKIKKKYIKEIFIFLFCPIMIFVFSYLLNYFSIRNDVGEIIKKPLNFYRYILYIFPFFFLFSYIRQKKIIFRESRSYLQIYIKTITLFLFSILLIFVTPIIQFAGEDIHRIFTIFTMPIIFLIMSKQVDKFLLFILCYIVMINFILFFKNFTYLIL